MSIRWKNFTFSEAYINEYQKLDLIYKIQTLHGIYYESEHLKSSVTHLIAVEPSLTPKYLSACAAGIWILKPQYVHDSFEAGIWLKEKKYEWNEKSYVENKNISLNLYSAPKLCRKAAQSQDAGMFNNWKVVILLSNNKKKKIYSRMLKQGGAKVFKYKQPITDMNSFTSELTHVILEKENECDVKEFLKSNILCVTPEYIHNYLLLEPKPDPWIFHIKNYESSLNYFNTYWNNKLSFEENNFKNCTDKKLVPLIEKLKNFESFTLCCHHQKYPSLKNISGGNFERYCKNNKFAKSKYFTKSVKTNSSQIYPINRKKLCKINFKSLNMKKTTQTKMTKFLKYEKISETNISDDDKLTENPVPSDRITKNVKLRKSIITSLEDLNSASLLSSSSDFEDETNSPSTLKNSRLNLWEFYLKQTPCTMPLIYPYKVSYILSEEIASKGKLQYFQENEEESSLQIPSIFTSSIKEEEYAEAIYFANCLLSLETYPSYQVLNVIIIEILQKAEDPHLANKAYSFLCEVLCLHPPINKNSRQYYMKALFYENENSAWNSLEEVIDGSILTTTNDFAVIPQSVKNNQLLFNFILSVLEEDMQNFLKSSSCPPKDIRMHCTSPLIVNIFWPRAEVGAVNHNCNGLFSLLVKLLSSRMCEKEKNITLLLIQRLISLVAECCQISQRNINYEIICSLGPNCDKYALAISSSCADAISTVDELKSFLTTLQPDWLKVKVCLYLLDRYFLMWGYKPGNNGIQLSLRKIIRQYMFPTPAPVSELLTHQNEKFDDKIHIGIEKKTLKQSKLLSPEITRINTEHLKAEKRKNKKTYDFDDDLNSYDKITFESKYQVHKFLLLLLNLILSYIKMNHLHEIMEMLRSKHGFQHSKLENLNEVNDSSTEKSEKQICLKGNINIPNILRTFLGQEPSVDTVIAISDDLYMANKFHNYQLKFEKSVKKMCTENSKLPKDILLALQLIEI
ncbi:SMC5-SMC6 complex localization factor protein 1-like isoform X2 [Centruroides vittatus]|uniref:SMC5-SMC6 complex localization factor protein 1-like isoform X2 n=1 Tax=Centruroides vittatus TaxID=120091 RepID=UPI00350F435A